MPRHADHTGFGLRDLHRLLSGPRYAARYVGWPRAPASSCAPPDDGHRLAAPTASPSPARRRRARSHGARRACSPPAAANGRARRAWCPATRPLGVFTTGALQQLVALSTAPVGRRAVVVGAEHVSFSAVLTLAHAGVATVAMVTEHSAPPDPRRRSWLDADRAARADPHRHARDAHPRPAARRGRRGHRPAQRRGRGCWRATRSSSPATGSPITSWRAAAGLAIDAGDARPARRRALRTRRAACSPPAISCTRAETPTSPRSGGRHAAPRHARPTWTRMRGRASAARHHLRRAAALALAERDRRRAPPPHGHFLRASTAFRARAARGAQDGRELWRRRYRELVPARSIHADASWVRQVDADGGAVSFTVAR